MTLTLHKMQVDNLSLEYYQDENGRWFMDDRQVSTAFGCTRDAIRTCRKRNCDVLLQEVHWIWGSKPGSPPARFWTKEGIIKLGDFIRTPQSDEIMAGLGERPRNRIRKELEYRQIICSALKNILRCIPQYEVGQFRIDLYFPDINLAVEIDEHDHAQYSPVCDSEREQAIKEQIGCEFLRVNPNQLGMNSGVVINTILKTFLSRLTQNGA